MEPIEQALRALVHRQPTLLGAGDRLLVAVSGGPDLLCLLHSLLALKVEMALAAVEVAHLDHGIRGEVSAADAAFVSNFCADRSVVCTLGSSDVAAVATARGLSIQEAAREERYAFLERTAEERGLNKIAVAHTRDDQIETVLLNLFRGVGLDGLRGMTAVNGRYIRPLLEVSRADVEAYCATHRLHPRRDPSNADPEHYTRNRIRLEVLPAAIRSQPGAGELILRLSRTAASAADYLRQHAATALEQITISTAPDALQVDSARLSGLHPALRSTAIRLAIEQVRGTLVDVTDAHVQAIVGFLSEDTRAGITTPAPALTVIGDRRSLRFERPTVAQHVGLDTIRLMKGGSASDPDGRWRIRFGPDPDDPVGDARTVYAMEIDLGRVDGALIVRGRRPGDRIDPTGMAGHHRKLQDIFVDAKIPQGCRDSYPIVCDDQGPIWVPGLAQSQRVASTQAGETAATDRAWLSASFEIDKEPAC